MTLREYEKFSTLIPWGKGDDHPNSQKPVGAMPPWVFDPNQVFATAGAWVCISATGSTTMQVIHTYTHTEPFYGPFSRTTRVSRCQKSTSGLYGARED